MKLSIYGSFLLSMITVSSAFTMEMSKDELGKKLLRAVRLPFPCDIEGAINRGADPNYKDTRGHTPLVRAIGKKYTRNVECLMQLGADPNIEDSDGKTALMWAAGNGFTRVMNCITKRGTAHLNQRDKYGKTALMWAAGAGDLCSVQNLLKAGADCHLRSNRGETALARGLRRSNMEDPRYCKVLIESMMSPTRLQKKSFYTFLLCLKRLYGTQYSNLKNLFKELLGTLYQANRIDIAHELDTIKNAPLKKCLWGFFLSLLNQKLVDAACKGDVQDVECFVRVGADVNCKELPLIIAVHEGHKEVVDYLIRAGADVNKRDIVGDVPLTWPVIYGYQDIAERLIKAGADVNSRDCEDGLILVMDAIYEGNSLSMVKLLIQAGANLYATDYRGRTALFFASKREAVFCETLIEAMLEREKKDESLKAKGAYYQLNTLEESQLKNYLLEKYFSHEKKK